jgi:hypothetical protein
LRVLTFQKAESVNFSTLTQQLKVNQKFN